MQSRRVQLHLIHFQQVRLLHPCPAFPLPLAQREVTEWTLLLRQEQRLAPPPVPGPGRRALDRLVVVGCYCAPPIQKLPELPENEKQAWKLRKSGPRRGSAWLEPTVLPSKEPAKSPLPLHYSRCREPFLKPDRRRNTQAVKVVVEIVRRALRASFCGAASAHASIYACKAFNTEETAESIRPQSSEPRVPAF